MKNHNAAIYLLSSRVKLLEECLYYLNKNWNYKYDYPIHVHHFDNIYSDAQKNKIRNRVSKNIFFHQIEYEIPEFIRTEDIFYNRKYLQYVKKSFSKKRLGYLHMEHFVINITSFGKKGCLVDELSQYDKLMRIDDDSYFKSKIDYDFFDYSDKYPFVTGYTWSRYNSRVLDTREYLWSFYKKYIKDNNIVPKSKKLQNALEMDNERTMHDLEWSAGNLNIYNMEFFKNSDEWTNYLKRLNDYGGGFKHRWGDIPTIGLFGHTYFEPPIFDLKLKDQDLYDDKFPSILSSTAPSVDSFFNVHTFPLLRIYYYFKKLFNK